MAVVMRRFASAVLISAGVAGLLMACSSGGETVSDDAAGSGDGEADEWVTVTDQTSGVSAMLPEDVAPQPQEIPVPGGGTISANIYLVEIGDAASVGFSVLTPPGGSAAFDLAASVEGSAANTNGTVVSSTPTTYEGLAAQDAEISGNQQGVAVIQHLRVVRVDDTHVVQVLAVGRSEDDNLRPLFDRLAGSMQAAAA